MSTASARGAVPLSAHISCGCSMRELHVETTESIATPSASSHTTFQSTAISLEVVFTMFAWNV